MGPRRILVAVAVLALGAATATAGVAGAADGGGRLPAYPSPSERRTEGPHGAAANGPVKPAYEQHRQVGGVEDGEGVGRPGNDGSGSGAGGDLGAQGIDPPAVVPGTSAGSPPAFAEVPAAAVSGPAPDAAAAAPVNPPALGALATAVTPAIADATPVPDAVADAVAELPDGLDALPTLGAVGSITDRVSDGPDTVARELLSSDTGRSLAAIMGLLLAIGLFLAIHRRTDRGDGKLVTASTGPDVARFR